MCSGYYGGFNSHFICFSIAEHLSDLSSHLQMWAQLESRLDELQSDLRSDGQTLRLLDTALNGGVVSMEVASSVRDVAKVLSESTNATQVRCFIFLIEYDEEYCCKMLRDCHTGS